MDGRNISACSHAATHQDRCMPGAFRLARLRAAGTEAAAAAAAAQGHLLEWTLLTKSARTHLKFIQVCLQDLQQL